MYGGIPITFDEVNDLIPEVDCLISATDADVQIITRHELEKLKKFSSKKVFVDLGMPRNIDPEINDIKNIHLFNISDLNDSIERSIELRKQSVPGAKEIVINEKKSFNNWHRKYSESDISKSLINHFNIVKEEILAVSGRKMSKKEFVQVDKITSLLVKRLLHQPLRFLKNENGPQREMLLKNGVLNKLFGIRDHNNGK